jgi:uncharacterized RmlC-like cupin family protein
LQESVGARWLLGTLTLASAKTLGLERTEGALMAESTKWRGGVRVVRAAPLEALVHGPSGTGRATAFDFAGTGGERTWIGRVSLKPDATIGAHHHGRHEVMVYVISGRTEIRWGNRLEFAADVSAGDFVYFSPNVPHQERNLSDIETVEFLVVRSDNERIAVSLDVAPIERPETIS